MIYKCVYIESNKVEKNRYYLVKVNDNDTIDSYEFFDSKPNEHSKTKSSQVIAKTPKKAGGSLYVRLRDENNKRVEIQARFVIDEHKKFFNTDKEFEKELDLTVEIQKPIIKKEVATPRNTVSIVKVARVNRITNKVDAIYNSINDARRDNDLTTLRIVDEKVINSANGYLIKWNGENIGDTVNIIVKGSSAIRTNEIYQYVKVNSDFIVEKLYQNRISITETRNDFKIPECGFHICEELKCYFKHYQNENIGDKIIIPDELVKKQILKIDENGNVVKKYFSTDDLFKDKILEDDKIRDLLRNKKYFIHNKFFYKRREYNDEDIINISLLNRKTYEYGKQKEEKEIIGGNIELTPLELTSDNINENIELEEGEIAKIVIDKLKDIKDNNYVITNYGRIFNNENGKQLTGYIKKVNGKDKMMVKLQKNSSASDNMSVSLLVYNHFISRDNIPSKYRIGHKDDDITNNNVNNLILVKINTHPNEHNGVKELLKVNDVKFINEMLLVNDIEFTKIDYVDGNRYSKYYASKDGKIFDIDKKIILSPSFRSNYHSVTLYDIYNNKTNCHIHRIIGNVFKIKNSELIDHEINGKKYTKNNEELFIDHINENKLDNCVENLQWLTNHKNIIKSSGQKITIINNNGIIIDIQESIADVQRKYNYSRLHPANYCKKSLKFNGYYRYFRDEDEIGKNVGIN